MTTSSSQATEDPSIFSSVPPIRLWLKTFLIGLCMGSADAVPGVSGGTIALIAGIYERLIAAITAVTPERAVAFLRALTPVDDGFSARRAVSVLEEVDVWFLLPLVGGIGVAIVLVTRIVHVANEAAPILLYGAFFGLIAASAIILLRELRIDTAFEAGAAVVGFVVAFLLSGHIEFLEGGGLPVVFVAGAVAVSAMILPGISGSLLLVILGQYTRMSDTLSFFIDDLLALAGSGSLSAVIDTGTVVVTFVFGGLVGLFSISRVIRRALAANRQATFAFLVALVVGALRAPITELTVEKGVVWTTGPITTFAVAAAVGGVAVLLLDWYAVDLDLDAA